MTKRKKPQHGGAREGAGRPAGTGEHDSWLRLRASSDLTKRLRARAKREGMTLPDWVRAALEAQLAQLDGA